MVSCSFLLGCEMLKTLGDLHIGLRANRTGHLIFHPKPYDIRCMGPLIYILFNIFLFILLLDFLLTLDITIVSFFYFDFPVLTWYLGALLSHFLHHKFIVNLAGSIGTFEFWLSIDNHFLSQVL